jgi:hypothetical protein
MAAAFVASLLAPIVLGADKAIGQADARDFPFDHELHLDAAPMRGSKRVPILTVAPDGAASIDLWCKSVQAQVIIVNDTMTIVSGLPPEGACAPERARADDDLLTALDGVTNWRREGDLVVLTGATTLRFHLATN